MKALYYWKALARGVILESIRRKDLWVVGILGFIIIIASSAIGFFGSQGLESFVKDLSTNVVGLFSTILAVVTTSRLMPDEVKNRTLYPLIARPISRFDLIMGKFLGAVAVSWIAFLLLSGLTAIALLMFKVSFEPILAQYVLCKMMGIVVVCAVSLMFSLIMTTSAAITMSFVTLVGSGMIVQALTMASTTASPGQVILFQIVNGILPQVQLFDLGARAANQNWGTVPLWVVGFLFAYMVAYSAAMIGISWLKFRRLSV